MPKTGTKKRDVIIFLFREAVKETDARRATVKKMRRLDATGAR